MYNIDVSNIKKDNRVNYIFLILGIIAFIVMISIAVIIANNENKLTASTQSYKTEYEEVEGDDGTMYKAAYYYKVDNKEYICSPDFRSSNKPSYKSNTIYYNPSNPKQCSTSSLRIFLIAMSSLFLVPIVFTLIGLFGMRRVSNRIKKMNELATYGKLIRGLEFETIPSSTYINGRNVPQIKIKYQMPDGTIRELISDKRYDMIDGAYGKTVDLLIDENDPSTYYIDFNIQ